MSVALMSASVPLRARVPAKARRRIATAMQWVTLLTVLGLAIWMVVDMAMQLTS
jgi:hypothetical protein